MADPGAMTVGLKNNLMTIPNFTAYEFIADKPEPPCAIVAPDNPFAVPESMGRGIFSYRFRVIVLVSDAFDDVGIAKLYTYVKSSGSLSVFAAVESDKTLGGVASNATVDQINQIGDVLWNELPYLGADFNVRVLATG